MLDLTSAEIKILDNWLESGLRKANGLGHYWTYPLVDHPMSQWAWDLGYRLGIDGKLPCLPVLA